MKPTCVPVVGDIPLLLLLIRGEREEPQILVHLRIGGDDVDRGLALLLAIPFPFFRP